MGMLLARIRSVNGSAMHLLVGGWAIASECTQLSSDPKKAWHHITFLFGNFKCQAPVDVM